MKSGDEWGWDGNLRWSDLTWRQNGLPWGHELSLTTGESVLFPGPLAQVRQRRRVQGGNTTTNSNVFVHTYRTETRYYILYRVTFSHSSTPVLIFIRSTFIILTFLSYFCWLLSINGTYSGCFSSLVRVTAVHKLMQLNVCSVEEEESFPHAGPYWNICICIGVYLCMYRMCTFESSSV